MNIQELHERALLVESAVSAVCPIDGIVFVTNDPATWTIQPAASATPEQIEAGNAALAAFDLSTVADTTKRNKIDAFATSDEPQAKSIRGLARVVLASVSNVIAKHNSLVSILASGRFPTQQEATALTIPVRDFATLMAAVKQAAINETNPNA
jgi:hypothetical protein